MKRSPAQNFALAIGFVLVAAGGLGFAYSATFGSPGHTDSVLGILEVNGWHNVLHIVTGVIGLLCAGGYTAARRYAIGFAIFYAAIAIWGFILGDGKSLLSIVPVNTEDSVLHALLAMVACGAGLASSAAPPPSLRAAEPGPGFRYD